MLSFLSQAVHLFSWLSASNRLCSESIPGRSHLDWKMLPLSSDIEGSKTLENKHGLSRCLHVLSTVDAGGVQQHLMLPGPACRQHCAFAEPLLRPQLLFPQYSCSTSSHRGAAGSRHHLCQACHCRWRGTHLRLQACALYHEQCICAIVGQSYVAASVLSIKEDSLQPMGASLVNHMGDCRFSGEEMLPCNCGALTCRGTVNQQSDDEEEALIVPVHQLKPFKCSLVDQAAG